MPRYAFQRGSATFRKLVEEQTAASEAGSLRYLPIKLPREIGATDFEHFLDVLYPLYAPFSPLSRLRLTLPGSI